MIGEEFVLDGLLAEPSSSEEVNSSHVKGITSETISAWKEATDKLVKTIVEVTSDVIYKF